MIRFAVWAIASLPFARLSAVTFNISQPTSNQPFVGDAKDAPESKKVNCFFSASCADRERLKNREAITKLT